MRLTVLCIGLAVIGGCGGVEVAEKLSEKNSAEAITALSRSGIQGSRTRAPGQGTTYVVTVPRGDAVKAWQVLRRRGRDGGKKRTRPGSLLAPLARRRALQDEALAASIARTLLSVDCVSAARVHVVSARRLPLNPTASTPPRASVLLTTRGKSPLRLDQVRDLVRGAVAGIQRKDISVVLVPGAPSTAASSAPTVRVGPFQVTTASRGPLLAAGVLVTLLVLGLGLALLAGVRRNRHLAARVQTLEQDRDLDEVAARDLESSLSLLDRSFSHRRTNRNRTAPAKRGARRTKD